MCKVILSAITSYQSEIKNYELPIAKMRLPKQAAPVKRPDIIYPHRAVDVTLGTIEDLLAIRIHLLHGANFNDPAAFQPRTYQQLKTSGGYGGFRY